MGDESHALTTAISIRLTKQDAELLRHEAARRGFATTGGFARTVILGSLARPEEGSVLLETILRVEYLVAECFKAVSPEEEQAGFEKIRESAEARSAELLESFIQRRSRLLRVGVPTSGT
ncbi:MAG: hypothetical protein ABI822_27290 [Bryobacteraceae bacterium]